MRLVACDLLIPKKPTYRSLADPFLEIRLANGALLHRSEVCAKRTAATFEFFTINTDNLAMYGAMEGEGWEASVLASV